MPARFYVYAFDKDKYKKGGINSILPGDTEFGPVDPAGFFVQLTISDATREEAHYYVNQWPIDYVFTLQNENANGWRYRVEVDPQYISASDIGRDELKAEMQTHVQTDALWEGCAVQSFTSSSMTVDIPKDGTVQTTNGWTNLEYLTALKNDITDKFRSVLNINRYYFDPADVDIAIAQGNKMTITKAQALSKIKDKIAE